MIDRGMISVIIPVYNAENYLKQCVQSVLDQTYPYYEILLVDDGSSDGSGKLCDEYAAQFSCIRVFHKENGGASTARNVGIQQAAGKYIFFLDSDDWIREDALERLIASATENQADLVFCEAQTINEETGLEITGNYGYQALYSPGTPYDIMETMMKKKEFHVAIWMLLLEKRIFDENGLLFHEGIIYEDMIISYQFFCLAQRAAHVKESLYFRRYRPNSVMTSKKTEKNMRSAITVYWEVARFLQSLPENRQSKRHIIRCAFHVLSLCRLISPQVKKQYKAQVNEIKKDILKNRAYGDTALKLDCTSHGLWWMYKAFKKVFR